MALLHNDHSTQGLEALHYRDLTTFGKSFSAWILDWANKKVVEEFWRKAASQGVDFSRQGKLNVTQAWWEPISARWHMEWCLLLRNVFSEDRSRLPMLLNGLGNPHSRGGSRLRLIHGSLGPCESSRKMASSLVQPFLQGARMWPEHRQADRQTGHATPCVAIDCYH